MKAYTEIEDNQLRFPFIFLQYYYYTCIFSINYRELSFSFIISICKSGNKFSDYHDYQHILGNHSKCILKYPIHTQIKMLSMSVMEWNEK